MSPSADHATTNHPLTGDDLSDLSDEELLEQIQAGSSAAEDALFKRYYVRLVGFARNRMNPRLKEVEPPSDVAQSAMKSVLMGIPAGDVQLEKEHDLWPLLAAVTLNKIRNRWRKMTVARRDIRRNSQFDAYQLLCQSVGPQSMLELNDLVEYFLKQFSPQRQEILRHILTGHGIGETAKIVGVSERTVYNTRQAAAASLQELLAQIDESHGGDNP